MLCVVDRQKQQETRHLPVAFDDSDSLGQYREPAVRRRVGGATTCHARSDIQAQRTEVALGRLDARDDVELVARAGAFDLQIRMTLAAETALERIDLSASNRFDVADA